MENGTKMIETNSSTTAVPQPVATSKFGILRTCAVMGSLAMAWWFVYRNLQPAAAWLTGSALHLDRSAHLGSAVEFFLFEVPKVLMLLVLVVFGVGIVRSFFTPQRTRAILAGKREARCGPM